MSAPAEQAGRRPLYADWLGEQARRRVGLDQAAAAAGVVPKTGDGPVMPWAKPAVMRHLEGWAAQMQESIAHADQKASTLLGWAGTSLAVVSTVLVSFGVDVPDTHRWAALMGLAGLVCLVGSVLALITVVSPRLGGRLYGGYSYDEGGRSFLTFASVPAQTVLAAACKDSSDGLADPGVLVRRVQELAAIALRKHTLLRLACLLLLAAVPLLAMAAAVLGLAVSGGGA